MFHIRKKHLTVSEINHITGYEEVKNLLFDKNCSREYKNMNIRKFLRDWRTGRSDFSVIEAAEYLDIETSAFRHLMKAGVITPFEGGGRGRSFYFSQEQLDDLDDKIEPYR